MNNLKKSRVDKTDNIAGRYESKDIVERRETQKILGQSIANTSQQ